MVLPEKDSPFATSQRNKIIQLKNFELCRILKFAIVGCDFANKKICDFYQRFDLSLASQSLELVSNRTRHFSFSVF